MSRNMRNYQKKLTKIESNPLGYYDMRLGRYGNFIFNHTRYMGQRRGNGYVFVKSLESAL